MQVVVDNTMHANQFDGHGLSGFGRYCKFSTNKAFEMALQANARTPPPHMKKFCMNP